MDLTQHLQQIGDNLRHYRQDRRLSQEELATQSGVSRRMIASIELAQTNVSLGTLHRLSLALGVTFLALIQERDLSSSPVRPGGRRLWEGTHPESHAELLSSTASGSVHLWQWSLGAGETYVAQPDPAGMQEMIHVLQGELTLTWQGHVHPLGPGMSLVFPSDGPYTYHNGGMQTVRFIKNVVTEPVGLPI